MRYSVITINYNNKDGLKRTIESVVGQNYADFEYIVIDGGSTDGSVGIIQDYVKNITYWVSEPDKGIYNAMNKGTSHATGDYLIFMNSGDCFHSSDVLSSITNYQEDIICGKILRGNSTKPYGHHKDTLTLIDLVRDTLPHQAMFIKRDIMIKYPYDENYKIYADWKFSVESIIVGNCSFRNIDIIVADYDISGVSANNNQQRLVDKDAILKELFPPRIIADYLRLAPIDDTLIDQSRILTQTVKARKLVRGFTNFILRFTNKK